MELKNDIYDVYDEVAKSEIVYFNEKGEVVDKESGSSAIIREYDSEGNLINEIWGTYGIKKK